ncbi:MAG: phenylacetate--CoA ligase [Candidatus Obscuribacterales bacterium]|nr:phenylacetate--CoA ligase [Candidatus Obscuribacterales bacterium]
MWNAAESMPRAELEKLQLELLNNTLRRIGSVPFYKEALREKHLLGREIGSLADLRQYPFTSKSQLRDQYPGGMIAVDSSQISRFHASSGTRGKPTLVAYTKQDLNDWADLGARSLYAAGVRPGDIVHNSYGYGLFTGGLGVHSAIERLGAIAVPASGGKTQQQIVLLKDLKARVLCSTPSYALHIAGALAEMETSVDELSLNIGIFGAEPWTEPMRRRIEAELNLQAIDIYGLSEIMGPGVSIECLEARDGLHIWEDFFLAEIINPLTLEPLSEGEEGELVITTLQKEAMPLLRYRTGDLSRLIKEKCKCGRSMARMQRVRARLDDMLIIRGVNVYPSEIENILLKVDELAPHYQLVLKRERSLDELSVQVEITDDILARWAEVRDESLKLNELSERIKVLLKENLGISVAVELLPARSIERSQGKASRLLDLRRTQES